MENHYFKTAEFAALCGVRKDTLLHYDHIGLLKPQWVGENGYRYYATQQLRTYDLIAALRRLGTPLAEIRDYLTRRSPQALLALLEEKEAQLAEERRRLEAVPPAHCAVVEAPDFTGGKFEEARYLLHIRQLLAWAREHGTVSLASGDIIGRESREKGDFMEDYYFCLVPPETQGWPLRVRPGGTYAVLYHQGSYQSEYAACRRLWEWVHAQGYPVDGDLYEENLVDYTTSEDPRGYLLKLSLKIQLP